MYSIFRQLYHPACNHVQLSTLPRVHNDYEACLLLLTISYAAYTLLLLALHSCIPPELHRENTVNMHPRWLHPLNMIMHTSIANYNISVSKASILTSNTCSVAT